MSKVIKALYKWLKVGKQRSGNIDFYIHSTDSVIGVVSNAPIAYTHRFAVGYFQSCKEVYRLYKYETVFLPVIPLSTSTRLLCKR